MIGKWGEEDPQESTDQGERGGFRKRGNTKKGQKSIGKQAPATQAEEEQQMLRKNWRDGA